VRFPNNNCATLENVVVDYDCCNICDPESATRFPCRAFGTEKGAPRAGAVSGKIDQDILSCLERWRQDLFPKVFGSDSLYGSEALISNHNLERISHCAPVLSTHQLRRYLIK
jgi:hypothetical protein